MRHPKGYVIHRGLSPINRRPYVCILTITSANRKTGNMAQVWILSEECDPVLASKRGLDRSICGDCPHRRQEDGRRTCYVNLGQAPLSIYRAWASYSYPVYDPVQDEKTLASLLAKRGIRWGAYGDPGILPVSLINYFNGLALFHTGYTHQWRYPFAQQHLGTLQASTDGILEQREAMSLGWKTFTVISKQSSGVMYAKQCPATVEHSQAQCSTCKLCNGARDHIFVHAHGPSANLITSK